MAFLGHHNKHFVRYNAKTCNFPVLLNEGENCFLSKGIYSFKATNVRVKKEITKFCNKLSLVIKFYKNITSTRNLLFTKVNFDINFHKYPSKSINKILNYEPVFT